LRTRTAHRSLARNVTLYRIVFVEKPEPVLRTATSFASVAHCDLAAQGAPRPEGESALSPEQGNETLELWRKAARQGAFGSCLWLQPLAVACDGIPDPNSP
jgi:hypothetical protein